MLARFTPAVRSALARAYEYAAREGSPDIGEIEVFEALLDDEKGAVLLHAAGDEERARIVAEIEQARSTGGLTARKLRRSLALGVDVDALVRQIEGQLGADTLAGAGRATGSVATFGDVEHRAAGAG